jgi:5-formyltetrahydrofolate cyclo-ligase
MMSSASIEDAKTALRREALARRDAIPAAVRQAAAEEVAARQFPLRVLPTTILSGFMPLKTEISPLQLMRKLAEASAQLALPKIGDRGKPLIMRAWPWGGPLDTGQWGIREPKADALEVDPDIVLVPLLAFDRAGHRIGYGAGYYDMTIAQLRARKPITAIGLAFAAQEIPTVPATSRDARLDLVLTERETIDFRGS